MIKTFNETHTLGVTYCRQISTIVEQGKKKSDIINLFSDNSLRNIACGDVLSSMIHLIIVKKMTAVSACDLNDVFFRMWEVVNIFILY